MKLEHLTTIRAEDVPAKTSIPAALANPDGVLRPCSRRWIWEQYDHMVMADTVFRPGGDAAVIRIHGTDEGLAVYYRLYPALLQSSSRDWGTPGCR